MTIEKHKLKGVFITLTVTGGFMSIHPIIELSDSSWKEHVEKPDTLAIIMFYSPTCPYCHTMEPPFEQYAEEFKDTVVFGKLNVVNNPEIVSKYGILGTPTFKLFCQGKPINELTGAVYPTLLKKAVEDALTYGSDCAQHTTWFDLGITGYA
jgi:thioredoxin 1